MKLINTDAIMETVKNHYSNDSVTGRTVIAMIQEFCDKTPPADVKPVAHGKWIYESGKIPKCSVCGAYSEDADRGIFFTGETNEEPKDAQYCPYCGAKMEDVAPLRNDG